MILGLGLAKEANISSSNQPLGVSGTHPFTNFPAKPTTQTKKCLKVVTLVARMQRISQCSFYL